MQVPTWFFGVIAVCAIVCAGSLAAMATRDRWVITDRGLLNQRTGEVCIALYVGNNWNAARAEPPEVILGASSHEPSFSWLCSNPPRNGSLVTDTAVAGAR